SHNSSEPVQPKPPTGGVSASGIPPLPLVGSVGSAPPLPVTGSMLVSPPAPVSAGGGSLEVELIPVVRGGSEGSGEVTGSELELVAETAGATSLPIGIAEGGTLVGTWVEPVGGSAACEGLVPGSDA